jgi:hypothetical protein
MTTPDHDEATNAAVSSIGTPGWEKSASETFFESQIGLAWERALKNAMLDFERQAAPVLGIEGPAAPVSPQPAEAAWEEAEVANARKATASARLHDGFYLRLMFPGVGHVAWSREQGQEALWKGVALGLSADAGWAIKPGAIVALGFESGGVVGRGHGKNVSAVSFRLGGFFYPDPRGGLYVCGAFGYAMIERPSGSLDYSGMEGMSWRIGVGKGWWTSANWSLDLGLAVQGIHASSALYSTDIWGVTTKTDISASVIIPALNVAITWN